MHFFINIHKHTLAYTHIYIYLHIRYWMESVQNHWWGPCSRQLMGYQATRALSLASCALSRKTLSGHEMAHILRTYIQRAHGASSRQKSCLDSIITFDFGTFVTSSWRRSRMSSCHTWLIHLCEMIHGRIHGVPICKSERCMCGCVCAYECWRKLRRTNLRFCGFGAKRREKQIRHNGPWQWHLPVFPWFESHLKKPVRFWLRSLEGLHLNQKRNHKGKSIETQ